MERLWVDGLIKAAENRDVVGRLDSDYTNSGIKSFDITKDNIADNIIKIANMAPVSILTGNEFAKGEKLLSERVNEYFNNINNSAYNDVIGSVELDYRAVDDDMAHGIGRNKAIAFKAVPDVIEKGKIIDAQIDWKDRNYDTVVIAAPVTIGKEEYIMGIIARRIPSAKKRSGGAKAQRHYVHEVIIEKTSADFKTGRAKSLGAGVNRERFKFCVNAKN